MQKRDNVLKNRVLWMDNFESTPEVLKLMMPAKEKGLRKEEVAKIIEATYARPDYYRPMPTVEEREAIEKREAVLSRILSPMSEPIPFQGMQALVNR